MDKQVIGNPDVLDQILATRVTGTIALPRQGGQLEGFACANITVVATSQELRPHAPNEFGVAKWVRTGNAEQIAGNCAYSINVPAGSPFYLTASGHGRFACTSIDVVITPTGGALGPFSVALGHERVVDISVSKVTCNVLT